MLYNDFHRRRKTLTDSKKKKKLGIPFLLINYIFKKGLQEYYPVEERKNGEQKKDRTVTRYIDRGRV